MAEAALGATFWLLLCVSITQGFQNNVEMARYETTEAVVGQNVTLLCGIKQQDVSEVFSVEWFLEKDGIEVKVALLHLTYGDHLSWPDIGITFTRNDSNPFMVSSLTLPKVTKNKSGNYICDFATFPSGSIRTKAKLIVKDVEIICNTNGSRIDVHYAEKVTIRCQATSPDAEYRWTKNTTLVSMEKSLEILSVTDTEAGVYTLSVNTGSEYVQKKFTISLQTTSTRADTTAVSPESSTTTSTSWSDPTEARTSTSPTFVSWSIASAVTVATMTTAWVTSGSSSGPAHDGVTSSVTPPTDSEPSASSTDGGTTGFGSTEDVTGEENQNQTDATNTQDPGEDSSVTTEQNSTSVSTTDGTNSSAATSPLSVGDDVDDDDDKVHGSSQRLGLLVLILLPVSMLILILIVLYRRHKLKERMDRPPPFKPPPPPVKYVALRKYETSAQNFPVSRCDSVADPQGFF